MSRATTESPLNGEPKRVHRWRRIPFASVSQRVGDGRWRFTIHCRSSGLQGPVIESLRTKRIYEYHLGSGFRIRIVKPVAHQS